MFSKGHFLGLLKDEINVCKANTCAKGVNLGQPGDMGQKPFAIVNSFKLT